MFMRYSTLIFIVIKHNISWWTFFPFVWQTHLKDKFHLFSLLLFFSSERRRWHGNCLESYAKIFRWKCLWNGTYSFCVDFVYVCVCVKRDSLLWDVSFSFCYLFVIILSIWLFAWFNISAFSVHKNIWRAAHKWHDNEL